MSLELTMGGRMMGGEEAVLSGLNLWLRHGKRDRHGAWGRFMC